MVASAWLTAAFGAVVFLFPADGAMATRSGFIPPSRSVYGNSEICPERCSVSGPNTGNWSVYPSFKPMRTCHQTMFYDFSLYDSVDDPTTNHRIHACSSFGPDFSTTPYVETSLADASASAAPVQVQFEVGWWKEGFGLAASGLRSLIMQIRQYIDHGHGATDRPFIMFGQSGAATIGLYIGQDLLNQAIGESGLKTLQDNLENLKVLTPSLAMQLCAPGYGSTQIFGVIVTSNGTFGPIQDAIKTWANATCLSFTGSTSFVGNAVFTTPVLPTNGTVPPTNATVNSNSTLRARVLHPRAQCRTVQVQSGDGCATLATKCGISATDFTKYNPGASFCSSLRPGQHVCCSSGDLPDFRPVPNPDGSCFSYQVVTNDNCANIAAANAITVDDIEDFNKNTWGWNGCKLLFPNTLLCLSTGAPPFPAPISNAQCGPQVLGSRPPTDGSKIADLNPCPLNACCNIWGQCGLSSDFCIDTNTGPPGTAAPGTFGCISNCGMDIIKGDGNGAIKIAYFEGYGLNRDCLFQDASQLDTGKYTHVHFAFATLSPTYEVQVGDELSSYQFSEFKRISGAKRILSFGGWEFSTSLSTYTIFRTGVTPANRLTMAKSIANFINEHGLDGVDIDWEYPGAPDIPSERSDGQDEGPNYLAFLAILKNLLRDKSVSIAAPASYWYLKQFPIQRISNVVDYIVFMTYDLHGQWDAHNRWSQDGCEAGTCLRSHVNLTETRQALAMITKAGVPGRKIVVGVTSYGRSFHMAQAGCWGPNCMFTGDRLNSDAKTGKCTGTAGYIADAETNEIMAGGGGSRRARSGRVVANFVDSSSHSNILVYDDNQWVSYMSNDIKRTRTALYAGWGMGGTTDWASDLQEYHPVPGPLEGWDAYKLAIRSNEDPKVKIDKSRTGKWTSLNCSNPYAEGRFVIPPAQRWTGLYADDAWKDVVRIWSETDKGLGLTFTHSVMQTLGTGTSGNCQIFGGSDDNCDATLAECPRAADTDKSGPAAEIIWNSLVKIHETYHGFYTALYDVAGVVSTALTDMENTFAPVPEPTDDMWVDMLIDLVSYGTVSALGKWVKIGVKNMAFFNDEARSDKLQEVVGMLVEKGADAAKDQVHKPPTEWTDKKQAMFSHYMGVAIASWATAASDVASSLFDGSDGSVKALGNLIAGGQFTDGLDNRPTIDREPELRVNLAKTFFGYSIPALWRASANYAFVLDSGFGCDVDKPLHDYLDEDTMEATGACVDGRQYYLVHPAGDSKVCRCAGTDENGCQFECSNNKFSAPPGIEDLSRFGNTTKEDIIAGVVHTWVMKGKKNGGRVTDAITTATIDALLTGDGALGGFADLPVCSADLAWKMWDTTGKGTSPNYPCDVAQGKNLCGTSSFVGQTSAVSPKVEDCLQIIRKIEGDGGWQHEQITGGWRQDAIKDSYESCRFGVEATGSTTPNAVFWIGGQDVIDIINEAIRQFGGSGRVSAYGEMACNGNIQHQSMKWGIY